MARQFSVEQWAAFAPGLQESAAWLAWSRAPWLPTGDDSPTLAEMPAMQRRRLERLGRMALQVAYWCQPGDADRCPLVFASRHGDIGRTHEMLESLARGEPLSPTQFGLSTHNAIAAQYSIARALTGNYLAISAGTCGAEAALTEALGLLAEGEAEVLVVLYEMQSPEAYSGFEDEPQASFAWAWRIGPARSDAASFSLETTTGTRASACALPHALEVLRFFLAGDDTLEVASPEGGWRWRRHA